MSEGAETEQAALVMRAIARKVALSRKHPTEFFNFVIREEIGERRKVTALPHQRVLFDFVLRYERSVIRMPPGFSKTFSMASLTMWLIGTDASARGAMISSTREQAEKPLGMVRDYIERPDEFPELRLVFPRLRRSPNPHDPWSQSKITVDRPPGIRDPSLVAVGYGGALPGSRLSWILVDDLLDEENTRTPDGRKGVNRWFLSTVLSRRDATGARIVICNTPWSDDKQAPDLTFALERAGWPCLAMNAEGDVEIINAPDFDTDDIRPSEKPGEVYRLTEHDPDPDEVIPLWPEKYGEAVLVDIRDAYRHQPHIYAQLYKLRSYAREGSRCKSEWIEAAKRMAQAEHVFGPVVEYHGDWPVFTGIDLGVGKSEGNDKTTFFTFAIREDGKRVILDAESGRFSGPEIVSKIQEKHLRFGGMLRVENNAAQDYIRQFALEADIALPIRAHTTGQNKVDPRFGVEGLFLEIANGAWIIPCGPNGELSEGIEQWVEECVFYRPPPAHTGDLLMASWFAREEARSCGFGLTTTRVERYDGGMIAGILSR
jgi:hypothetical protein